MSFINRLLVDDDKGRVVMTVGSPVAGDPYLVGLRYNAAQALFVSSAAVEKDSPSQNGVASDNGGAMYIRIDNPPPRNDRHYNGGLLLANDGALCVTIQKPIAGYVRGCPVDNIGQVCIGAT